VRFPLDYATKPETLNSMTDPRAPRFRDRAQLGAAFAGAARRYWLTVFPRVNRELSHWRDRAREIGDPVLRQLALDAQRKRGNMEGAAAFATFAPHQRRATVVRALVAFQSAYNYLDLLAEQPRAEPIAGARALHEALLHALDPTRSVATDSLSTPLDPAARQPDYYAHYPQRDDNGYLAELVDTCRTALAKLPSYPAVADAARRAAERVIEFQTLNLSESQGDHDAFARWAHTETPGGTELRWWETAAAGGSSLGIYALIAAASDPLLDPDEIDAIGSAYFPWIGALHSLLDHLVDRTEDAAVGQRSLIDYYTSPEEAAVRMRVLAERAVRAAGALPRGDRHSIVLAGMAGYYLSDPQASTPEILPIAQNVREAIGALATPTLLVFKARRFAGRKHAQPAESAEAFDRFAQDSLQTADKEYGCQADILESIWPRSRMRRRPTVSAADGRHGRRGKISTQSRRG
jgi:tetraprenyl-beta-curcumene synthase